MFDLISILYLYHLTIDLLLPSFHLNYHELHPSKTRRRVAREKEKAHDVTTKLKILVAEDNLVNQKVMMKLLSQLHHEYTIASDGEEVFEIYKTHGSEYDVLLMDLHMPKLDGIGATRAIRQFEHEREKRQKHAANKTLKQSDSAPAKSSTNPPSPQSAPSSAPITPFPTYNTAIINSSSVSSPTCSLPCSLHRIPIVAVTAAAMEEDSRKCRESGMDDILLKPLDSLLLRSILQKWVSYHLHCTVYVFCLSL